MLEGKPGVQPHPADPDAPMRLPESEVAQAVTPYLIKA